MPKTARKPLDAFVFDAYGTLFDVHSVTTLAEALAPGRGAELSRTWRAKQLEYTWLQSLMAGDGFVREDFAQVTAEALDYAIAALVLPLDEGDRARLAAAYLTLDAFPDAHATLAALAPRPRWILSNGTLAGLTPLVRHNGMEALIDGVLSVDAVGVYKPAPQVYALAAQRLALPPARIGFVSSNCWDAIGAKAYGFTSFWINRTGAPIDRHGPWPDHVLGSLGDLEGSDALPPR
ncbi:MAG: haloacid dehalogenase type II [Betaproteobacteria bacterium]|nr:haloacid dehalogenase type II [Betaproteobacteria bacterium]